MYYHSMHKVQASILKSLRRKKSASFSTLMKPTGLLSDAFKFHLQKLVQTGYISKLAAGHYSLTPKGKEFANNLDDEQHAVQKQPKLSVLLVVPRRTTNGKVDYLVQRRQRNPFLGFWGLLSGPVQWGELPEDTAARELRKQTELEATFSVRMFYRQRDYRADTKQLLEDKLFAVVVASGLKGALANTWSGGHNSWVELDEVEKADEKYFPATQSILKALDSDKPYLEKSFLHTLDNY